MTTKSPLLSLDDALKQLLSHATALGKTERVSTLEADGRVLAQDLVSALQVPSFDNSAMDGYAVRAVDCTTAGAVLQVTQRIAAGSVGEPLHAGQAARIFTGAPVPPGADAVVMQELCATPAEGQVQINTVVQPAMAIRRAGEDVRLGEVILKAGQRLQPASLGLAASIGASHLMVADKPRVALFSTGDELIMPGDVAPQDLPPGAIFNSNRFFLKALLARMGCDVSDLGVVPDDRQATIDALREAAREHDLILTSGGVSVGEEDHLKPAVQTLGRLDLWALAIKPGKPFAYGQIDRDTGVCHYMGLPGNPVASFVTCLLLVRPFVLALQGAIETQVHRTKLVADFDWPKADKRREFLRARRTENGRVELYPNQSSGVLTSAVWGDGIVDNPPANPIAKGDLVDFISLSEWMS